MISNIDKELISYKAKFQIPIMNIYFIDISVIKYVKIIQKFRPFPVANDKVCAFNIYYLFKLRR